MNPVLITEVNPKNYELRCQRALPMYLNGILKNNLFVCLCALILTPLESRVEVGLK